MTDLLKFPSPVRSDELEAFRAEVRDFLSQSIYESSDLSNGFDPAFSKSLGERGWLGMTWPKEYGGHERNYAERYIVLEEMLAAGAPVAAHWIADRQSGTLLLNFGTEEQKQFYLPRIAAGTFYVCIGMSEPDAGSDLAAIRTRATPVDGGYLINGTKLWTSNAHRSHAILLFCRTSDGDGDRKMGLSQLLVDLETPGVTVRPIRDIVGESHFNEVQFTDVFVPSAALVGTEGNGWNQVMRELALERSGPERFLSSFFVLKNAVRALRDSKLPAAAPALGRLTAHLAVLRRMSQGVAALIGQGQEPVNHASIIKDLGSIHEQETAQILQDVLELDLDPQSRNPLEAQIARSLLVSPSYSLRGGTREILRGIIARAMGLR